MKINFDQALKELDGRSIVDQAQKELTLKSVACTALSFTFNDEQLSGEEKAKRGLLAVRIYANPDTGLTIEEVATIKKVIGKAYGPIVVAQAWEMLEKSI